MDEQEYILPTNNISHDAEENSKLIFIRRIMGIQTALFIFFTLIVLIVYTNDDLRKKLYDNYWIIYIAFGIYGVIFLLLIFFKKFSSVFFIKYILLFSLTASLSVISGVLTSLYDRYSMLSAIIIGTMLTIGLTLYSMILRSGFENWKWIIFIYFVVTIFILVMMLAVDGNKASLFYLYCWLCEFAYGIYLVIDVAMVAEPKDCIIGALHIYIDYITMILIIGALILSKLN